MPLNIPILSNLIPWAKSPQTDSWVAYRTPSGQYGIAKTTALPPGGGGYTTQAIGSASSLADLVSKYPNKIWQSMRGVGMPPSFDSTLTAQLDAGSVLRNPSYVQIGQGRNRPQVSSNKPTSIGSEAASTNALGQVSDSGNPFGLNFGAVTDFLNFLGWILHPLNWLRLVEFIVGLLLTAMGISILTRGSGGTGIGTTARRVVSITPAGRTIRTMEGRRMGRREGQREAARMEARQKETLDQRRASAVERERINLDARETART